MNIFMILSNMLCLILHVTDTDAFPKPLSKKDERDLLEKMSQGDENAKNKLIEHNLRLVAHIIKKGYPSRKLFLADYGRNKV